MIDESPDRRQFPRLVEELGHDPARFLDRELVGNSDPGPKMLAVARIRGIDRLEVVRAYKAVERALGRSTADGPREGVMRLLERREEFLEEQGERPERLQYGPRRPPEYYATETGDEDDERPRTAAEKLSRMRSQKVATDGGEPAND